MASYGTEKVQSTSLNLGFPTAFGYNYARHGAPERFAPEQYLVPLNNTSGHDFQAQWHEQKMRDANSMARAKVQSTHMMNIRAQSSAHNYPSMPQAVLGQRKFANPSNGAYETASTRLDQYGSPWTLYHEGSVAGAGHLVGGVLRTSAGQRHGKQLLDARIGQLNKIAEAKAAFFQEGNNFRNQQMPTPFSGAEGTLDSALTSQPLVELANILQSIKDSLISSGNRQQTYRDILTDSTKAFALIVRMATQNTVDDMANVLEFIEGTSSGDGIGQLLEAQRDNFDVPEHSAEESWQSRVISQIEWWGRIAEYLKEMIKIGELPPQSRVSASNAYIKSLGFSKLLRVSEQRERGNPYRANVVDNDLFIDNTNHIHNPQNAQRAIDLQARAGRSGAFINPRGESASDPYSARQRAVGTRFNPYNDRTGAQFTQPAPIREDSQYGYIGDGGEVFSANSQNSFAYGSGEFQDRTGGRPRAWLGEVPLAEYGEAPPDVDAGIEEEEQSKEAEERPQPGLNLSSRKDETTGEWDVAPPLPSTPPSEAVKYKESDVPRTVPELRQFILKLNKEHGYKQAIYKKGEGEPKARSVRINTIARMKMAGLL